MVHPTDFTETTIVRSQENVELSNRLFPGRLEKGVILRSRLRALFVPSSNDVALSEKTLRFSQNVVDGTAAFELVVPASRLAGLPERAIEAARRSAEEKGKDGHRLTQQAPSYGPVMSFADDRSLREEMYRANVTRAVSDPWDNRPILREVLELRREKAAAAGKKFDLKFEWRPIGKISRYLRAAVVYAEDMRFFEHDGVDWDAIEKAIDANLARGSLAIGGSTITQQLAKNLYLSPDRSFIRKLREMLIAFSLEDDLSKQRILELYLNVVEWGDGIFGAEAAARHHFGVGAAYLSAQQSAQLAAVLPNPREWSAGRPGAYVQRRARWIRQQMRQLGGSHYIDQLRPEYPHWWPRWL